MTDYVSLTDIVSNRNSRQYYLTNRPANIERVEKRLAEMGLGDKFEYVGSGDRAVVISPYLKDDIGKEIVIRLCTEFEEPGFVQTVNGRNVRMLRPQIPQVLQAIHTELVDVYPLPGEGVHTKMRIEILPRLKVAEVGRAGYRYGSILQRELRAAGYAIGDPKEQNIGLLPNGTPVIIDPGEITWPGKRQFISRAISAIKSGVGMTYEWTFDAQRAHLQYDWKQFIASHEDYVASLAASEKANTRHRDNIRETDSKSPYSRT